MRSGLIVEKSNNSIKLKLVFRHWEGRPYYLSMSETGFVKIQHAFTVQYKTNKHTALSKLGLKGNSSHAVLSSCKCLSSYHVHWLLFYCFDKGMAKGNSEKKEFFCPSQFQRHRSPSWREAWQQAAGMVARAKSWELISANTNSKQREWAGTDEQLYAPKVHPQWHPSSCKATPRKPP